MSERIIYTDPHQPVLPPCERDDSGIPVCGAFRGEGEFCTRCEHARECHQEEM